MVNIQTKTTELDKKLWEEIIAINSGSTPITLRGLRGQQQSSLSATLQGFAGNSFVRKFHKSLPGGTTFIIRHHNSSFNWSKLGEGLMKENTTAEITWNKMQVSNNLKEVGGPAHLFQQLIGYCR